MSKLDLYPNLRASPKDAAVATGTVFNEEKIGLDTHVLGGYVTTGSAISPANYTSARVTFPDSTTEVYKYYVGTTIIKTVTLFYTDDNKTVLSGWDIE